MSKGELTEKIGEDYDLPPGDPLWIAHPLLRQAMIVCRREIDAGVCEVPPRSNRGPRVDEYLLGIDGGGDWLLDLPDRKRPWCARAMVWAFVVAAAEIKAPDPFRGAWRGGGLASGRKMLIWARPLGLVRQIGRPGLIGVIEHDDGSSHVVGMWDYLQGTKFASVEGNSRDRFRATPRALTEVTAWIDVTGS